MNEKVHEYMYKGAIIIVHRPTLTNEEKKKKEQKVKQALNIYGIEKERRVQA